MIREVVEGFWRILATEDLSSNMTVTISIGVVSISLRSASAVAIGVAVGNASSTAPALATGEGLSSASAVSQGTASMVWESTAGAGTLLENRKDKGLLTAGAWIFVTPIATSKKNITVAARSSGVL